MDCLQPFYCGASAAEGAFPTQGLGFLVWPVPPLPHRRGGHGVVLAGTVDVFDSECSGKAIVTINN